MPTEYASQTLYRRYAQDKGPEGIIDVYYNCGEHSLRIPLDSYWIGNKNIKLTLHGDDLGLFEIK